MSDLSTYSRLIKWEVFNFMSIEHGECEFDDKNIVNLKGYNDSGKSAMLRALDVLMSNMSPQKQVEFIQDDKDFFRIIAYFDDGVSILRDKYINGQSLYEMYKDGTVIFRTKVGNALARVSEEPEPIRNYLGLIQYDNTVLNSRSCFEKQIGVQTTGSENYKMFNTVLKSEEIASASAMLNNDKNKLLADINALDAEVSANKNLVLLGDNLTEGMISYLKEHDANADRADGQIAFLDSISQCNQQINSLVIYPELQRVDTKQLSDLILITDLKEKLDEIEITPQLNVVDTTQLNSLVQIKGLVDSITSIEDYPELRVLDTTRLETLERIQSLISGIAECDTAILELDGEITRVQTELDTLAKEMKTQGLNMVKCPSCGKVFDADEHHVD